VARQSFPERELALLPLKMPIADFTLPIAALLSFAAAAFAQELPTPSATPSPMPTATPALARSARISFLPPPLEGTISLGIYDGSGKLVRVLHQQADLDEFTVGADALVTKWDGKNDDGEDLPRGKYHARGFAVGQEVKAEYIGFFFNDWITDETSPRIRWMAFFWPDPNDLQFAVDIVPDEKAEIVLDQKNGAIIGKKKAIIGTSCDELPTLPNVIGGIECAEGKDGTLWVIDSLGGNSVREVKQLSKTHDLLCRLTFPKNEPQPESIAASLKEDRIFLIEQNEQLQRLRGLTLLDTKEENRQPISNYKVDFEKKIVKHDDFSIENGKPLPHPNRKPAPERTSVRLVPNPLANDARSVVDLGVGFDDENSFLKTMDGLPLFTISQNSNLVRALITKNGEKSVDVWQDDGASVEQIRVSNIDKMMAFDCGEFELK
jgi:hypothetical protein